MQQAADKKQKIGRKGAQKQIPSTEHSVAMGPETHKTCVLILGMHRSGTSALAGVVSSLGCSLPGHLIKASPRNEKGFFESSAIWKFNEELLHSAGAAWSDFEKFNDGWFQSPVAASFHKRALAILEQEFADSVFFVLKDPRICKLFPFWSKVLTDFGCDVKPVLTIRQPMEVAASLNARNGFDASISQLVWLRNVLEAEWATRGIVRFHTNYENLLHSWATVANKMQTSLGFTWPRSLEQADQEISQFLTPHLRHHQLDPTQALDNPLVNAWVRGVYEILLQWAQTGENPKDHSTLDQIRVEFDAATNGFQSAFIAERSRRDTAEAKIENLKSATERETQAAQDTITSLQQEQATAQDTIASLQQEQATAQDTITSLQQEQATAQDTIASLQQDAQETAQRLQQDIKTRDQQIEERGKDLDFANQALHEGSIRISALDSEVAQVRAVARQAEDLTHQQDIRLQEQKTELEDLQETLRQAESALKQRQHENADLTTQLAILDTKKTEQESHFVESLTALEEANAKVVELNKASETLRQALKERDTQIAERFKELATLTQMLQERDRTQQGTLSELKDIKHRLHQEQTRRIEDVEALYASTSWKITSPLRRMVLFLRGQ